MIARYAFFGVFDGTVKEHASEFVHKNILQCLFNAPSFLKFDSLSQQVVRIAPQLFSNTYRNLFHYSGKVIDGEWATVEGLHDRDVCNDG